eukprot:3047032-Rhodomonas_salina.1
MSVPGIAYRARRQIAALTWSACTWPPSPPCEDTFGASLVISYPPFQVRSKTRCFIPSFQVFDISFPPPPENTPVHSDSSGEG